MVPALILASTSRYRHELLSRLRIPFDVVAPDVDEAPRPGEKPADLACRLAVAKANVVSERFPDAVVIGSDQVADLDGVSIGKPGSHATARAQLRLMSGRMVIFQTAVAIRHSSSGYTAQARVPVTVRLRSLDDEEIENYLQMEQPYDCAGSAKSEALGIALLASLESSDPTALVGLPLIETCRLLRGAGIDPLRTRTAGQR